LGLKPHQERQERAYLSHGADMQHRRQRRVIPIRRSTWRAIKAWGVVLAFAAGVFGVIWWAVDH